MNLKEGESIYLKDSKFTEYLDYVEKWKYEMSFGTLGTIESVGLSEYHLEPIALNKSGRIIAGTIRRLRLNQKYDGGYIHLLPPTTKCNDHDAVELLIDIIHGEKKTTFPWRSSIEVPGLKEIEESIKSKETQIMEINNGISKLKEQERQLDEYRDLITGTGDEELTKIVQKTLDDLGISTKRTEPGFVVDLVGNEVAIEVTGTAGNIKVDSPKMSQISRFVIQHRKDEKVILVANTHRHLKPEERRGKEDFTKQVIDFLTPMNVCLITSSSLFELWKRTRTGELKKDYVKKKILEKSGEFKIENKQSN